MTKPIKKQGSAILAMVETDIKQGIDAFNKRMEELNSPFRMHNYVDVTSKMGNGSTTVRNTYVTVELSAIATLENTMSNDMTTSVDWI